MKKMLLILTLFFVIITSYSQCVKGNWAVPYFNGSDLYAVDIMDSSQIVAVGTFGTMIKSTDAGNSWHLLEPKTNQSLKFLDFQNNTGYACGEYGVLLKSFDNGDNWIEINLPVIYTTIHDVDVITPDKVYILGTKYEGYWYEKHYLLKTLDGGATWDSTILSFPNYYTNINFLNPNYGVLSGDISSISKVTTDGGSTWQNLPIAYGPDLLITDSLGFDGTPWGGMIYNIYTEDTIEIMNTTVQPDAVNEFGKFYFHNLDTVWNLCENNSGYLQGIARVTNGITSIWQKSPAEGNSLSDLFDVDFIEGFGVAVGDHGRIQITNNYGKTWRSYLSVSGLAPVTLYENKIQFIDDNIGYTGGQYGRLYKTTDGGSRWKQLFFPEFKIDITDIQFLDENTGYVVGLNYPGNNFNFYRTTNGGINWYSSTIPLAVGQLTCMHFLNDSTGYVGDSNGSTHFTTNSGNTWITHNLPVGLNIDYLFFTSTLNGYCENYRTTNGGTSWTLLTGANGATSGYFFNDTTGFIATNSNLKYTNNGSSFGIVPGTSDTRSISFENNIGLTVGDYGHVFVSTNYGVTWQNKSIPSAYTNYHIKSCDVTNNGNLHMVCYEYQLDRFGYLRSVDGGNTISSPYNNAITPIEDICITNDSTYFYSDIYGVTRTTDYGETWQNTSIRYSPVGPNFINFLTKDTGYVNGGGILQTFNAGKTYTLLTADGACDQLFHFPSTIKWINNRFSNVVYSTNNGSTWNTCPLPSGTFSDLQCFNSQTCYVRKDLTDIYKTTDGGLTWNITGWSGGVTEIDFVDEQNGFAIYFPGSNHRLFKTTDGGTTWHGPIVSFGTVCDQFEPLDMHTGYVIRQSLFEKTNTAYLKLFKVNVDDSLLYPIYLPSTPKMFEVVGLDSLVIVHSTITDNTEGILKTFSTQSSPSPSAYLVCNSDSICSDSSVTVYCFTNNIGLYPQFDWIINDDTLSTGTQAFITVPTIDSNTTVRAIVSTNYACSSTVSLTTDSIQIAHIGPSAPTITIVGSQLNCPQSATTYVWFENGIPLGINSANINFTSGNLYQLVLETNGCYSDTASLIPTSGLDENHFTCNMHIYPNPTKNDLYASINANFSEDGIIRILSATGVIKQLIVIHLENGVNFITEISVFDLASGFYFIELSTSKSVTRKGFVKN
jgi:photosystem II stability/assembly factor-like uncharacterized protein